MKKKYLYNGQLMELTDIQDAAKQSNIDVNSYIQKAGIREVQDTYSFNGKNFSAKDILDAANQSNLGFDDYITKAGFDSAEKKNPSVTGTGTESNITSPTPAPATSPAISPSVSQESSFGQYDVFNNPLNIQAKPVVSVAGVPVSINSPLPETSAIPTVSDQKDLASQLQTRINTKTYNPADVDVVAQSMKVSVPAANAYMDGKIGTGTLIHFNDIKAEKQNVLRETVNKANADLGRNDNYDEIFASPDLAGAYLQKIETLYGSKANSESVKSTTKAMSDNPALFALGSITVNESESKGTIDAAQKIKSIISNDIIDKISEDGTLTKDQKVKKIYNLTDSRDKVSTEKAIEERLSPIRYLTNLAISNSNVGTGTSDDIDLLNANKAGIEYKVNKTLQEKVSYNEALKKSIAEEYASKVNSGEISTEDEKAKESYTTRLSDIDSANAQISREVVPDSAVFEKYPVLYKSAIANAVNEFNAIQSGNVEGYEDGGYQGISLTQHLTAKGFDVKDQKVQDFLSGDNFKDYSFFGRPIQNVVDVFTNTGKAILDLTPLRDDAAVLAEKKQSELFPTQVGSKDEYKLTSAAKVGQNIGNTTGQVLGQGLLQMGTAGLGRMAGLSKVAAANTAFWSSGTLTSYDQAYKDSFDFIDNGVGRTAYAGLIALANGASEKIFPDVKLFQIPGVQDNLAKLASKVSTKEFTQELASDLLDKTKNSFVDYAVKYAKNVSQETAEEVATDLFESGTRFLFGDPNVTAATAIESATNTAIQTAIGTSLIGAFGAHKDVKAERNTSSKSTIYNAAIYHDQASDAINLGFEENQYDEYERDAKFALLNTARESVNILNKTEKIEGKTLDRPARELYVANLTAEAALTAQKKGMDEIGQKSIDEKISNLQNQRQQILKGDVKIDDNGNITAAVVEPIQPNVSQPEVQNIEAAVPENIEPNSSGGTEAASPILDEEKIPDITVSEVLDKTGTYKGEKGSFYQDGQTVVFKVDGKNKEYELGNVDEVSATPISDFGITTEQSVVGVDDSGNIKVRDTSYVNNFSDPLQAINRDENGNVVSVNLETTDGKKRTFRGNVAEDVAYNIHLKEITKDNETKSSFENFINEDEDAQNEINNAAVSTVAEEVASTPNGEVQREAIKQNTTTAFADRIISGEKLTSPEDLQYYENNKTEIENLLKERQRSASTPTPQPSTVKSEEVKKGDEIRRKEGITALKNLKPYYNQFEDNSNAENLSNALTHAYKVFGIEGTHQKENYVFKNISNSLSKDVVEKNFVYHLSVGAVNNSQKLNNIIAFLSENRDSLDDTNKAYLSVLINYFNNNLLEEKNMVNKYFNSKQAKIDKAKGAFYYTAMQESKLRSEGNLLPQLSSNNAKDIFKKYNDRYSEKLQKSALTETAKEEVKSLMDKINKVINVEYDPELSTFSENKPIPNEGTTGEVNEPLAANTEQPTGQGAEAGLPSSNGSSSTSIQRAKDIVNSGVVKGFTSDVLKDAANNNQAEFLQHLKDISEQAQDPNSANATVETYGQELVDIANELNPPVPPTGDIADTPIPQADGVGIIHAATAEIREEFGLGEYGKEAQTFKQWDAEADARIKNGEVPALLQKLREGGQPSDVEVRMMGKYIAYLKGVASTTRSNEDIAKLNEAIKLSDSVGGTENARGLVARKGLFTDEGTLADFFQNELEAAKVDVLTDEQKATVEKEHKEISAAQQEWDAERDRLNQQIKDLQAQQEIDKNKPKKKPASTTKKTHEDYVKERKAIVDHLREKLRKARSGTNVTVIPYAADLFAAAPDVARLVKSLVEEGVTKLADVIDNIHDTLKEGIPDITKDDVRDLIAGVYNETKQTRNEITKQIVDLRTQANLVKKLESLLKGEVPLTEKKRINNNKEIAELRGKIRDFEQAKTKAANDLVKAQKEEQRLAREFDKEQNKAEKERIKAEMEQQKAILRELNKKTPEQIALQTYKTRTTKLISQLEEDLRSGNYETPPAAPKVKLDKEALAAKDKLIKLKNERQLRLLRQQYQNRSVTEKAVGIAANILNIPRALMTTLDFSAVLRQGIIPTISHPVMAFNAGKQMFKSSWSQKEYDRWFYDLENSPNYNLMKESGLALTDNTNPNLTVREEDYMSNLVEKIPIVGQQLKTKWGTVPGLNLIKKSERAYAAYINKLRADLFERFTASMRDRGLDFENSPKQYKEMAEYINNATGRGSLGESLNKIAPLLNGVFFSPRLIASRINMLTYLAQPRFYKTVPVEVRKAYFADMAKFIGVGVAVLALAKYGGGDDDDEKALTVETDPRSSDFGKIKQGDTRWDIWGGFQPFIRVAAQVISGQRKSSKTGKIIDITGEGMFSKTRGDVLAAFARGKLAPVPAMAVDLFSGRTAIGEKILMDEWGMDNAGKKEITIDRYLKDHLLPLTYTGMEEVLKEKGIKSLFTVGIPSVFGVGVQTYKP